MKLSQSEKIFSFIYIVIVLCELLTYQLKAIFPFPSFTKPLILLSLIIFYALNCKSLSTKTNILMILALNFSLAGDILLMLVSNYPNMFIAGLIAFLLAHIMYILVFNRKRGANKPSSSLIGILLTYALLIFFILKNGLNNLLIPVIIYMVVILGMLLFASLRKGNVHSNSYHFVLLGAIFFIISDSILALNKFYQPIIYSHFLIMGTYAIAQYLITLGMLKQNR